MFLKLCMSGQHTMYSDGAGFSGLNGKIEHPKCRIIPVHPGDKMLLGMSWRDHLYVDTVLPFGLCSTPIIFTACSHRFPAVDTRDARGEICHALS